MIPEPSSFWTAVIIIGSFVVLFIIIRLLIRRKSTISCEKLQEPLETEQPPSKLIKDSKFVPAQFFSEGCYIFMFVWDSFKSLLSTEEINVPAFEIEETEVMPHFGLEADDIYLFSLHEALSLTKDLLESSHNREISPIVLNEEFRYYIFFGENKYNMAKIKLEYSDNCPGYGWTLEKETSAVRRSSDCITFRKKVSEKIVEEKSIT